MLTTVTDSLLSSLSWHWAITPHLALHIPDGFLNLPVMFVTSVAALGLIALALNRVQAEYQEKAVPLMGVCAAFVFAAKGKTVSCL